MLAVLMVCKDGKQVQETVNMLRHCPNWVRMWVDRFEAGGLDGLRDRPRSGRPRIVSKKQMDSIMLKITSAIATPVSVQQRIADVTGEKFHITYVKKIMHQYGMSAKTAQKYHINHASAASVCNWQQYMKKRISRLKKNGFTITMLDEAFFVRDVKAGCKYWSLVAKRIFLPYVGKHENFAVYGTMLENGNQMFRIYKKFNSVTFVKYLKELQ